MEEELLKVNILTIAVAGLLMLLTGLFLYLFREMVSQNLRFFLPIPPLGVAAYVFAFNLFRYYDGKLPHNPWDTVGELVSGAVISGVVFCFFITATVLITNLLKDLI